MLTRVARTSRLVAAVAKEQRTLALSKNHVRSVATSSSESVERLVDESVMDHLVCPISKYPLRYDAARGLVICPEIRVAYPIRDGVPVLVPSEGRLLRDDEDI